VYLKLNAIGIEKFAVPTPIAKVPSGQQNSEQYQNLTTSLENFTQHHSNYLTIPSGDEWGLDLHSNTYDPAKVEESINAEDKRIAKGFSANFMELGTGGSGGAYALSNDLSDFFLNGIEQIAGEIATVINEQLIPNLIDMNFGPQPSYPKLKFSGISDKAGTELANILKTLVDGGMLTADDTLQKNLRKRYGLPETWEEPATVTTIDPLTGLPTETPVPKNNVGTQAPGETDPEADPKIPKKPGQVPAKPGAAVKPKAEEELETKTLSERVRGIIEARRGIK
jgi:hypothetical protein